MTIKLSLATLGDFKPRVARPSYARSDLSPGIVHIGVGNFHRAHQAMYLHQLFNMGLDHDWAIVGAGIKHFDDAMRSRLQSQDWLTTVIELDPAQFSATITGSMIDFVKVDPQHLVNALSNPAIRIVSLTVTEGGYFVDAQSGLFDTTHPDILTDSQNPESPATVFGIIINALRKRRAQGDAPFTVMSCDNLPENGHVTKRAILGLARMQADELAEWIDQSVAFPNSMVDCITPATGERELAMVKESFGIDDAVPVVCEPFRQWVLEDTFTNGRPAFEKVGVEFVDNVASYELMKLRILNGGHASIAYPAGLLDIHYVHDAMQNPLVTRFLNKLERDEIIPTVPVIAGVNFDHYYTKIVERFSNEAVGDTIPRLCHDGANRQPKFILPAIQARLSAGQTIDGLALVCALWCRYCYGTSDSGKEIPANDLQWQRLTTQAKLAKDNPSAWLEMADIYGQLVTNQVFERAFSTALTALWRDGTPATLDAYGRA